MKAVHKITDWDEWELNDSKFRDRWSYFYCPKCKSVQYYDRSVCPICGEKLEFTDEPIGIEEQYLDENGEWQTDELFTGMGKIEKKIL